MLPTNHHVRQQPSLGPLLPWLLSRWRTYMGVSQNSGYLFGGPNNKAYSILGSIVGYPNFGKLPYSECTSACPCGRQAKESYLTWECRTNFMNDICAWTGAGKPASWYLEPDSGTGPIIQGLDRVKPHAPLVLRYSRSPHARRKSLWEFLETIPIHPS